LLGTLNHLEVGSSAVDQARLTKGGESVSLGLVQNPAARLGPQQALTHEWLRGAAPSAQLDAAVQANLHHFKKANKLER